MLDFFASIANGISMIIDFIVNSVKAVATAIGLISTSLVSVTASMGYMPLILSGFIVSVISIAIVKILISVI